MIGALQHALFTWGWFVSCVVYSDHILLTLFQLYQNANQRLMWRPPFLQLYRLSSQHVRGVKNAMAQPFNAGFVTRPVLPVSAVGLCLSL